MQMEIVENVYDAHRKLSACSAKFLEFVKDNPQTLKHSNFHDVLHPNFEAGPTQAWPVFINRETKHEMEEASISIFNLIRTIPQRLFSHEMESISWYYRIPADLVKIQLDGVNDEHLANLLGRGDFIFSPSGLKCVEYNISSSIGGWQVAVLEPLYLKTPIISKFLQEYQVKTINKSLTAILLEHLLVSALKKFSPGSRCNEINIAIALPNYSKSADQIMIEKNFNRQYNQILQLKYSHLQGEAIICDFRHFNIEDECIFYENKRIKVLLEFCQGDVPPEILEIFKKGNILLCNGPITGLLGDKLNLAVLSQSEDSDLFTLQEKEIIKKYIPWTRRLTAGKTRFGAETFDLQDFVLSHREKLVIKSAKGQGGDEVHIGRYTPRPQWEILIKNAAEEMNWVVQEYIESSPYLFQSGINGCTEHHAIWGLFVFGSRYGGGFLRILPKEAGKGVINTHQGAEKTVIFEVDE
jgi:hypothetical protein